MRLIWPEYRYCLPSLYLAMLIECQGPYAPLVTSFEAFMVPGVIDRNSPCCRHRDVRMRQPAGISAGRIWLYITANSEILRRLQLIQSYTSLLRNSSPARCIIAVRHPFHRITVCYRILSVSTNILHALLIRVSNLITVRN